jgi:hypothetical protein
LQVAALDDVEQLRVVVGHGGQVRVADHDLLGLKRLLRVGDERGFVIRPPVADVLSPTTHHRCYRGTGRVALEVTLHAHGISFRHSRPYHPQTCGKIERFHQTLKKWLTRPVKTAPLSLSRLAGLPWAAAALR